MMPDPCSAVPFVAGAFAVLCHEAVGFDGLLQSLAHQGILIVLAKNHGAVHIFPVEGGLPDSHGEWASNHRNVVGPLDEAGLP